MKRRSLLWLLLAGSAGAALAGGRWSSGGAGSPRRRSVLVLLELRGGNDGLSSVAPLRDPLYRQARPRLALAESEALPLADGLALQLSPAELRGRPGASFDPAEAGTNAVLRQMLALEQAGALQLQNLRRELAPVPPGLAMPLAPSASRWPSPCA